MKEFLISNYKELLVLAIGIINIFVSVFVRKVKLSDTVFEQTVCKLPDLIVKAEQTGMNGAEKKAFVVSAALSFISQFTGKNEEIVHSLYYSRVEKMIENILATPKKKEEK